MSRTRRARLRTTARTTVSASGGTAPYSHLRSNLLNGHRSPRLAAGHAHTVTVTDAQGCEAVQTVVVDEPTPVVAEVISSTDETCFENEDGTATVNATGGTTPYSYLWSNGNTAYSYDSERWGYLHGDGDGRPRLRSHGEHRRGATSPTAASQWWV